MPEATLPDYLAVNLDIVSIGINPSLYSVEHGFYFARPGNRFWPVLNACGLIPEMLEPGPAAIETLFMRCRIGFTDVVKRATKRADALDEADFEQGARLLKRKLDRFQPRIAWFHGKSAFEPFLRCALHIERGIKLSATPKPKPTSGLVMSENEQELA